MFDFIGKADFKPFGPPWRCYIAPALPFMSNDGQYRQMSRPFDDPKRILLVLHVLFFLSGVGTVLIGQVLPILGRQFSLDDKGLSFFFPAQFAGSLSGTLATNWFAKKGRLFAASIIGAGLMAAGILLMNSPTFAGCVAGFLINGVGIGLTLPSVNLLVLKLCPERPAAALSVLNFFWGVGAIVSNPFVYLTSGGADLRPTTMLLAVPLITVAVVLLYSRSTDPLAAGTGSERSETTAIWSTPIAWAIALFNFIHVGFESGVGGWLTTYSERIAGRDVLISPTLMYFLFFVIGRGVAPVFLRFVSENVMLMASLLTILGGMTITLSAGGVVTLAVGAAIAGFGTSSIFPTNVSRFYRTFGTSATSRATPLFLAGTFGGAVVTWLIGYLSGSFGDLRSGMLVLLLSVIALIVIQGVLWASSPKTNSTI